MRLREQIERDEQLRLTLYVDTTGYATIGYGRNLEAKGISIAEADIMLENDLADAIRAVREHIPWSVTLDEARLGVLQNMAFNLGIQGLLSFRRMLTALEVFDYDRAAVEMEDSRWYQQTGQRAQRLKRQMISGVWE